MPKHRRAAVDLAPLLDGSNDGERIPELARHGLQQLIALEVAALPGADRHERTAERLGYRNGHRSRSLTTQVGCIELQMPKLLAVSFLLLDPRSPSILEPRRRMDQALYAVIMETCIGGVSTRRVDALIADLGTQSGISKSQVSRICQEIDQQVQAFLSRPLEGSGYACVYLDATKELLGIEVGDSQSATFWAEFNCCAEGKAYASLKELAPTGVRMVVSDAHVGLSKARGTPSIPGSCRAASGSTAGSTSLATCCSGCPSRKASPKE